jgi:hypothetical protein
MDGDEHLIRYLLGELPPQEREQLESRYFADHSRFQQLLAIEDELIDAYLRDELPGERKRAFEDRFLASAEQRRKVDSAREFLRRSSVRYRSEVVPVSRRVWPTWPRRLTLSREAAGMMAATVLLTLAASVWWILARNSRLPLAPVQTPTQQTKQLPQPPTDVEKPAPKQPPAPQAAAKAAERNARESVIAFALTPGMVRDFESASTLRIPPHVKVVRFEVQHDDESYSRYRAVLRTVAGAEVWSQVGFKPPRAGTPAVLLTVPAERLRADDYILSLSGKNASASYEDVADYPIRVKR